MTHFCRRGRAVFDVPDGETSADSDEDDEPGDGYYFLLINGQLRRVTNEMLQQQFTGKRIPRLQFEGFSKTLRKLYKLTYPPTHR